MKVVVKNPVTNNKQIYSKIDVEPLVSE